MTQAYNLSQLANNLNSAGQLDANDGLVNAVPVGNGGTGVSTLSGVAYGNGSSAFTAATSAQIRTAIGTMPVGNGGTGVATLTGIAYGNGTLAFTAATGTQIATAIGSSPVQNATTASNGGVTSVNDKTGAVQSIITLGTVNTSSGVTSKAFTGIPSWANRVTLIFQNIVLSATSQGESIVQIGSGSYASSGYYSTGQSVYAGSGATTNTTVGFVIYQYDVYRMDGALTLTRLSGNTWACNYMLTYDTDGLLMGSGTVSLAGALDRVRLTTKTGVATYSGSLNMMYE